jgi:hypothetical protein
MQVSLGRLAVGFIFSEHPLQGARPPIFGRVRHFSSIPAIARWTTIADSAKRRPEPTHEFAPRAKCPVPLEARLRKVPKNPPCPDRRSAPRPTLRPTAPKPPRHRPFRVASHDADGERAAERAVARADGAARTLGRAGVTGWVAQDLLDSSKAHVIRVAFEPALRSECSDQVVCP